MEIKPDLNLLKLVMIEKNMTVAELAHKAEIPGTVLIDLLEGEKEFTLFEIYALSEALDLSDERKRKIFLPES